MKGQWLTFICGLWTYAGKVSDESYDEITLDPAFNIFDVGSWEDKEWKTIERIPGAWHIRKSAVESWGAGKASSLEDVIEQQRGNATQSGQLSDPTIGSQSELGRAELTITDPDGITRIYSWDNK